MVAGLRKQRLYSASASGSKKLRPCLVFASFFSMNQSGSAPIIRSGKSNGWILKNQCQENVAHCLLMLLYDVEDRRARHLLRMIKAHAVQDAAAAIVPSRVESVEAKRCHHLNLIL